MISPNRMVLLAMLGFLSAAQWGCRSTYYSMWEKMGVEKREILKERVEEARDGQAKASEQFKDALTRLKEIYGVPGGELETAYQKLKTDFDRSEARAKDVRSRIYKVEQVAGDLFTEWREEIETYSSSSLRQSSQLRLDETRRKYQVLIDAMRKAERGMEPVLVQFRDQVLYLKHNLNALAIGSLKGESLEIEREIANLIRDMNRSIAEADSFIGSL